MNKFRLSAKLLMSPCIGIGLMLVVVFVLMHGMHDLKQKVNDAYGVRMENMLIARDLEKGLLQTQAEVHRLNSRSMAGFPADQLEKSGVELKADMVKQKSNLERFDANTNMSPEELALWEQARKEYVAYQKIIMDAIDISVVDASTATTYLSRADTQFQKLSEVIQSLVALETQLGGQGKQDAEQAVSHLISVGTFVVAAALIVAFGVVWATFMAMRNSCPQPLKT